MSDIFLSYAREDAGRAKLLAEALQAQGWTVFWDRTIPPGQTWRDYIGAKLSEARCLIVAWTEASVASEWVMEEADDGKQRGILVPVFLDEVALPLGFRHVQAANLIGWDGDARAPDFQHVVSAIDVYFTQSVASPTIESTGSKQEVIDSPQGATSPSPVTASTNQTSEPEKNVTRSKNKQTSTKPRRRVLLVSIIILVLIGGGLAALVIKKKTKKPRRVVPTEQPTRSDADQRFQLR